MQRILGSRGILVAVGGVVAVILVAAYFLVWPHSHDPSAYSKERASFEAVGTHFEASLQQLRQHGEALSARRVAEFAASHDVRWGIVQASGNERDGNLNDWSPAAVKRAASTEKPTQDFAYIKTGPDEDRYVGTYAHPVEVFGQGDEVVVFVKVYD